MINNKKVWAIVCGAMRYEFEVLSTLAWLCKAREQHLVDGIVVSTWKGEIDSIPNLKNVLGQLDIHLLEIDTIPEHVGKFMSINYARQAVQLNEGLKFVPEDVFILKCRTDMSENHLKKLKFILEGNIDLSIRNYGALNIPLTYRLAVFNYGLVPFMGCDITYIGYKSDIRRMVLLEPSVRTLGGKIIIGPDIDFFRSIFIREYPLFTQMFVDLEYWSLFRGIYKLGTKDLKSDFELPGVLNKIYALYFCILYCCFYNISDIKCEAEVSLEEIFSCGEKSGVVRDWTPIIKASDLAEKIVFGDLKKTPGYIKLYKEICKIATPGYAAEKLYFTKEDYDETIEWCKKYIVEEIKFLLPYNKPNSDCPTCNYKDSIRLLFPSCNSSNSEELTDILNEILEQPTNYYDNLYKYIDRIKKIDISIYEKVIVTIARTDNIPILKSATKDLLDKKLSPSAAKSIEWVFKRREYTPEFFQFPMSKDKMLAIYYFSRYIEPNGDVAIPRMFYDSIVSYFHLAPDITAPANYTNAFIEAMKKTVIQKTFENKFYETGSIADFLNEIFVENSDNNFDKSLISFCRNISDICKHFNKSYDDIFFGTFIEFCFSEIDKYNIDSVRYILMIISQELHNLSDALLQKTEMLVKTLADKFNLYEYNLVKAILARQGTEIVITKNFNDKDNDEFFMIAKALNDKKSLNVNEAAIRNLAGNENLRILFLELLLLSNAGNCPFVFFSIKSGFEFWLNHKGFIEVEAKYDLHIAEDESLYLPVWPYTNSANKSCFAAYIGIQAQNVYLSVEFACELTDFSKMYTKKITERIDYVKTWKKILSIKKQLYPFYSSETFKSSLQNAISDFDKIGQLLIEITNEL